MLADHAPSMDQIGKAIQVAADEHPLRTGLLVHGFRASYSTRSRILWVEVQVTYAPDEIYAEDRIRQYAIHPDGRADCASYIAPGRRRLHVVRA